LTKNSARKKRRNFWTSKKNRIKFPATMTTTRIRDLHQSVATTTTTAAAAAKNIRWVTLQNRWLWSQHSSLLLWKQQNNFRNISKTFPWITSAMNWYYQFLYCIIYMNRYLTMIVVIYY
jgi:hypothetical protein